MSGLRRPLPLTELGLDEFAQPYASRLRQRIVVDGLGRLPQFSHASVTDGLVFVSGTLGTSDGLGLVEGGVGPQTTQTLRNIERILTAAGADWDDVAKVSVYLADMADFAAMNEAYDSFFPPTPPARITIGGVGLALGAAVEIECIAERASRSPDPASPARTAPARRIGFVEHDGESLSYEVVGEGGVPLVISHGAGGNHAAWYQQVAPFASDRTVITSRCPSSASSPYFEEPALWNAVVRQFLDAFSRFTKGRVRSP